MEPDSNFNSFGLSSFDKVITKKNFLSVIVYAVTWFVAAEDDLTYFPHQFSINLIQQLNIGI